MCGFIRWSASNAIGCFSGWKEKMPPRDLSSWGPTEVISFGCLRRLDIRPEKRLDVKRETGLEIILFSFNIASSTVKIKRGLVVAKEGVCNDASHGSAACHREQGEDPGANAVVFEVLAPNFVHAHRIRSGSERGEETHGGAIRAETIGRQRGRASAGGNGSGEDIQLYDTVRGATSNIQMKDSLPRASHINGRPRE